METLLQQHGDTVTAVYAHNDNMALGAIEAIKAAGKKPGQDIIIVSIDAVKAAFEAMVIGLANSIAAVGKPAAPVRSPSTPSARKAGERRAARERPSARTASSGQGEAADLISTRNTGWVAQGAERAIRQSPVALNWRVVPRVNRVARLDQPAGGAEVGDHMVASSAREYFILL
ncbi:MAG: hypothetical protein R3F11_30325 [Verrucomicrobiales bacterium]